MELLFVMFMVSWVIGWFFGINVGIILYYSLGAGSVLNDCFSVRVIGRDALRYQSLCYSLNLNGLIFICELDKFWMISFLYLPWSSDSAIKKLLLNMSWFRKLVFHRLSLVFKITSF